MKLNSKSALNSFRQINHGTPRFEKNGKGETICRMEAENSIELYLRIIQCEDTVEILEPLSFRRKLKKLLQKVLDIYEDGGK
jgi:predicted DNA-binding transcriptional regulator YafY